MDDAEYKAAWVQQQLDQMKPTIDGFFAKFVPRAGVPDQRTVLFFPGGMASELQRADQAYDAGLPSDGYNYETIWYDIIGVGFLEKALLLDMNGDKDRNEQMIVAQGAIEICGLGPYAYFEQWCDDNNLDLLVVGWDFRRQPAWIVEFFLNHLVPEMKQCAVTNGWPDPFRRATIVGHSFGGMVAKWILNDHAHAFCRQLQHAVTVATPFYGYAGHAHRFFEGEPLVGSTYNLPALTKAIATMKGGYSLLFLDGETYDKNEAKLLADVYRPPGYPSVDRVDATVRADPYNPGSTDPRGPTRYPTQAWPWQPGYLAKGLDDYKAIAEPLHETVRNKFHNIRYIQVDGNGAERADTFVSQRWEWIRQPYDWTHSPVWEDQAQDKGPGDGTQPAWSARLVTQPADNIHTIKGTSEHGVLMDEPQVRRKILELVRPGQDDTYILVSRHLIEPASREQMDAVKRDLENIARMEPREEGMRRARAYIDQIPVRTKHALVRRWFIELLKGPVTRQR